MKNKKQKLLPNFLWELIELALEDLEEVEAMPDIYKVNMDRYHSKYNGRPCNVCFAGAIIAKELKVPPTKSVSTPDFDLVTRNKLQALDRVRVYNIVTALELFYQNHYNEWDIRKIINLNEETNPIPRFDWVDESYEENPDKWKANMRAYVEYLKKLNPKLLRGINHPNYPTPEESSKRTKRD